MTYGQLNQSVCHVFWPLTGEDWEEGKEKFLTRRKRSASLFFPVNCNHLPFHTFSKPSSSILVFFFIIDFDRSSSKLMCVRYISNNLSSFNYFSYFFQRHSWHFFIWSSRPKTIIMLIDLLSLSLYLPSYLLIPVDFVWILTSKCLSLSSPRGVPFKEDFSIKRMDDGDSWERETKWEYESEWVEKFVERRMARTQVMSCLKCQNLFLFLVINQRKESDVKKP